MLLFNFEKTRAKNTLRSVWSIRENLEYGSTIFKGQEMLFVFCLFGIGWHWMVLDGIDWYWVVLDGIGWYCMVLDGIGWYWIVLDSI